MMKAMTPIPAKQLTTYFRRAAELADFFEDLLEEQGAMKPSFLRGLKQAHRDTAKGNTRTIRSLADLR